MSTATPSDEGLRIDILLFLRRGPSSRASLIRGLGIGQGDHLDWNLRRLSDLVLSSGDQLKLTEAGEKEIKRILGDR